MSIVITESYSESKNIRQQRTSINRDIRNAANYVLVCVPKPLSARKTGVPVSLANPLSLFHSSLFFSTTSPQSNLIKKYILV